MRCFIINPPIAYKEGKDIMLYIVQVTLNFDKQHDGHALYPHARQYCTCMQATGCTHVHICTRWDPMVVVCTKVEINGNSTSGWQAYSTWVGGILDKDNDLIFVPENKEFPKSHLTQWCQA